jgi:hypothetical protein
MPPAVRFLVAFLIVLHGFVYVRVGAVLPGPITGWLGRSWLLGDAVSGDSLRSLAVALHVAAGVAIMACGVLVALAPGFGGTWRFWAAAGAIIGVVAFAVFWDGQVPLLAQEGALGALLSLALLSGAIAFPNAFR